MLLPDSHLSQPFYQLRWQRLSAPDTLKAPQIWCCQLVCPLPLCAGNKWLKLKHHIKHIQQFEKAGIFTFGGAYSNHLAAVAAAGQHFGFRSHALVRHQHQGLTPTLAFCQAQGMRLHFSDADTYRKRHDEAFLSQLAAQYPDFLLVPEGGSSQLGVEGVRELNLRQTPEGDADLLVTACGSGGTAAGLALGHPDLAVLAIAVVKDPHLAKRLAALAPATKLKLWQEHQQLRYGRFDHAILQSCLWAAQQGVAMEPIYTGKALHSLWHWLDNGQLQNYRRIVFFHTGGLQGLAGLVQRGLITEQQYRQLNLVPVNSIEPVASTPLMAD